MATLTANIIALWQAPATSAPSAAGNASFTKPAKSRRKVLTITPTAGAGAYTYIPYFPVASCVTGDEWLVRANMPASANPTLEFRNDTAGGTLIKTVAGTGTAFYLEFTLVFNGTAWT